MIAIRIEKSILSTLVSYVYIITAFFFAETPKGQLQRISSSEKFENPFLVLK